MSYVFVMIFIVATLFSVPGYSFNSPWWTHFTYMFSHVNIWHLLINSVSFFTLYKMLVQLISRKRLLSIIMLSAFIVSFSAEHAMETKGASGMIYTMIGMFLSFVIYGTITFKKDWYNLVFAFGIIAGLLVSYFTETSNTTLHVGCMILGMSVVTVYRFLNIKMK